jgi:acetyl-CoA acyltransferase
VARLLTADGQRIAIVAGLRTPFCKQGTAFRKLTAVDLGTAVVRALLERTGQAAAVDRIVYGQVIPSLVGPNIGREIVLDAGLRRDVDGYTLSRACASGYQATVDVAQAIAVGDIEVGVSGGADSASDVPIAVSRPLADALLRLRRARSLPDRLRAFSDLKPRDLLPELPALAERSTGLTMGESAEKMAQENGISRAAQDELAHRSHLRAAAAWADGRLAAEVVPVRLPGRTTPVAEDNLVRRDSRPELYRGLRPIFDPERGTITAGNSSALTDGASALLLMREDRARALGLAPMAYLVSYAFTAVDPAGQMLLGPAYAIPRALARAGMRLTDVDLIDLHEAFAAQVLSVTDALESPRFAERELGLGQPVGRVDPERLNVGGGSIALGHPFAATGARQITQTARELGRRGGGVGLCSACAAGGLAAAMVIEVEG